MRILHISPDLYTGGAQKFCVDICNELAKDNNNEVILCSIERLNDKQKIMHSKISSRVKFISLNKDGKNPFIMLKVLKMIFSIKPDITHTHTRAQFFSAFGLILYGRPNIHTIHSMAHEETSSVKLKFYKILYKLFNFTPVSISDQVLKSALDLYGHKYNVKIYNGVQKLKKTESFHQVDESINALKKDENTKIFVSIGRFYPVKNQELLIEAFESMLEDGFDAHLLILGSLDVVPEYADICKNKIKTIDRIHLLGEKFNVSDYLIKSDVLCFSSIYEGLPMAIIEAMSVGIPTISTPVGGIVDIIEDAHTGYFSKGLSVKSYKEALKNIFLHNSLNKDILISKYEDSYTIEKCAQEYKKLYIEKVK